MPYIKILSLILVLLIFPFCLTGCQEGYKDAYIYIEFEARPLTLDPQLAFSSEELTVARSLFDTLLRFDNEGKIVPSAAESYDKKGNIYTFKLRKDAKWTNGDNVTAHDFVFALRRAVDPKTAAPYANMLGAVENADSILKGDASPSALGVSATDDYTLVIRLQKDDPEFLKVLTSAITMPCNESFFEAAMGKYGLTIETTPSNGSYYVRKWTTEGKFLIRLAKNLEYTGPFEANSMRIYYTCSDKEAFPMLDEGNTDLAYITTDEYSAITDADFKTVTSQNVFYGLFLSPELDPDIRKALLMSVESERLAPLLKATQTTAYHIYPQVLSQSSPPSVTSYITYNPEAAHTLYADKIKNGFKLEGINIMYAADPSCSEVAKDIAGHWQQTLSCFINISEKSSYEISSAFSSNNYDIIIAPVSSSANTVSAYHSSLGLGTSSPAQVAAKLFGEYLCYPLFFSSTGIAASEKVENLESSIQNGILDVSMLIKNP